MTIPTSLPQSVSSADWLQPVANRVLSSRTNCAAITSRSRPLRRTPTIGQSRGSTTGSKGHTGRRDSGKRKWVGSTHHARRNDFPSPTSNSVRSFVPAAVASPLSHAAMPEPARSSCGKVMLRNYRPDCAVSRLIPYREDNFAMPSSFMRLDRRLLTGHFRYQGGTDRWIGFSSRSPVSGRSSRHHAICVSPVFHL